MSVENKWLKAAANRPNFRLTHGIMIQQMIFIEEVRLLLFKGAEKGKLIKAELMSQFLKILVDQKSTLFSKKIHLQSLFGLSLISAKEREKSEKII